MINKKKVDVLKSKPLAKIKVNLSDLRPTLCFILPTYNREKTIGSALEQISSQILRSKFRESITILVSENQSTDRSAEIAKSFSTKYDFIRVITPEQHLPSGEHNLFFALRQASADFVWSFADDDLLLQGSIDYIYEHLLQSSSDFILVNSQYWDSDGQVICQRILDINQNVIYFDSFTDIFSEVGPLTILASFSSAIYRLNKIVVLDLDGYLSPCPIYAHVFAYLEAFSNSRVEILSAPLVVLRKTTANKHWENVAEQFGWYMYYPWTGSLATHILRARSRNLITVEQYSCALNSNENGRYSLIANLLTQFVLQLLRALESYDPREVPSRVEFENISAVVQSIPYVTVDTLDFLLWGRKYFGEICSLLTPQNSIVKNTPNPLSNAIQSLNIPEHTDPWILEIREKLIEKLHFIKQTYVSIGTTSPEARPFLLMGGQKFVIFQLATHYILMSQTVYQENWHIMNPNHLDAVDNSPDWFIFGSFDEAMKRYFELEHSSIDASKGDLDDSVILKIFKTPPWDVLSDIFETEDVQSFLDAVSYKIEMEEVRQVLGIILGCTSSSDDAKLDLRLIESTRQGFIDPNWYRRTYFSRTQGLEREILKHSPLVHYVMIGARKGWSLSPFFDEFLFIGEAKIGLNSDTRKMSLLTDRIGLAKYFTGDCKGEVSPFFSVCFYLEQCKKNSILIEGSPIIHFLTTGIKLGLAPHLDWDEALYMDANPDVKLTGQGAPYYGWIHWCTNGRFEKRKSGVTRRL